MAQRRFNRHFGPTNRRAPMTISDGNPGLHSNLDSATIYKKREAAPGNTRSRRTLGSCAMHATSRTKWRRSRCQWHCSSRSRATSPDRCHRATRERDDDGLNSHPLPQRIGPLRPTFAEVRGPGLAQPFRRPRAPSSPRLLHRAMT